jgi:GTPase SAR1 family protein
MSDLKDEPQPIKYTCLLVGNCQVGKSKFMARLQKNEYTNTYVHTVEPEVSTLILKSSQRKYMFTISECNEHTYPQNISTHFDSAIIMYDCTCEESSKSVSIWYTTLRKTYPNIPIVICQSKFDNEHYTNVHLKLPLVENDDVPTHNISSKYNRNMIHPFQSLLSKLNRGHSNENLELTQQLLHLNICDDFSDFDLDKRMLEKYHDENTKLLHQLLEETTDESHKIILDTLISNHFFMRNEWECYI